MGTEDTQTLSAWEERTLDLSLASARRRALGKSRRLLEAGGQLLVETDGIAFTVQDVIDRSELSLGSFYRAFAGKDELLLALFEEAVAYGVAIQEQLIADLTDPLEQLRACLTWFASPRARAGSGDTAGARAITMLHFTLASTRPTELARALAPQLMIFLGAVERGVASGQIRADIPSRRLAEVLLSLASLTAHSSILQAGGLQDPDAPDDLWDFCVEGLLNRDATVPTP